MLARRHLWLCAAILAVGAGVAVSLPTTADETPGNGAAAPPPVDGRLTMTRTPDGVRTDGDANPLLRPELEALARSLTSGGLEVTEGRIRVFGVTGDGGALQEALGSLENRVGGDTSIVADVVVIDTAKPAALLCRELFVASTRQSIRFQQAGAAIRRSSYSALDRLAEFAADCPAAAITITGHSDSVGDPAFNLDLSRRRAQAVADYLGERGVAAKRLKVVGAGAAEPIADNATHFGRRQNRRIEFELSMPDTR